MHYERFADIYDAVYVDGIGKDYAAESQAIHDILRHHVPGSGKALLDIGCGTGGHLAHLAEHYTVLGMDLSEPMLAVARRRHPEIRFIQGDMCDFSLEERFDAIVCLFSAIGYARTVEGLQQTLATMRRHLRPHGAIVIEPWFAPKDWQTEGGTHATFIDRRGLKIARMNLSEREGNLSRMLFHFLVGTHEHVEYFTELHEMGLFTQDEYLSAMRNAGLRVEFDPHGLTGRGLYIGVAA